MQTENIESPTVHHQRSAEDLESQHVHSLDEMITGARDALDVLPESHEDWSWWLSFLGNRLIEKYEVQGSIQDLQESIVIKRKELDRMTEHHVDREKKIFSLLYCLNHRMASTETIEDLQESIKLTREGLELVPFDHLNRAWWIDRLGSLLHKRFQRTGSNADLDEGLDLGRKAAKQTTKADPQWAGWVLNQGIRLGDRYLQIGGIEALNEAIQTTQEALAAMPETHEARGSGLNNLAYQLADRYSLIGAIADLDESVRLIKQSLHFSADNSFKASRLGNLGMILHTRYQRTGMISDLDDGILYTRQAINLDRKLTSSHAYDLINLGVLYTDKYTATRLDADLDEAINFTRQGIEITSEHNTEWPGWLNNLARQLNTKYIYITGRIADLDEAIQLITKSINATVESHKDMANRWYNLGWQLGCKHRKTRNMNDFENSLLCFEKALDQAQSPLMMRIHACRAIIKACSVNDSWHRAHKATQVAITLIPRLITRSHQNPDKQHLLGQVAGFASEAAAAAIQIGEDTSVVLDFLEQGRGILTSSLAQARPDISLLKQQNPHLCSRFHELHQKLEMLESHNETLSMTQNSGQPISHTSSYKETDDEFQQLIGDIRAQPGFERFLLPPSKDQIRSAAGPGPIAIVNVGEYRCDAILVKQDQICSLPLPALKYDDIEDKERTGDLKSQRVLEWLWDTVAAPILEALGYLQPPTDGHWPHLWWIPTGSLSKFPLHAAGYHRDGSCRTVLDRVMSSYSSSIKTILQGRSQPLTKQSSSDCALLVAMQDTKGYQPLFFANDEVKIIRALCESVGMDIVEPERRKESLVFHLPACKIFHFAGHGNTNALDPLRSHLVLDQGDLLTVSDLLDLNLRAHAPFLAYLSACGTGRIRDKKFVDESIHLISACQVAGFRHVIGTLWEVSDKSCVTMARIIYEALKLGGQTDELVCLGLHNATRELRGIWLANEEERRGKRASLARTFTSLEITASGHRDVGSSSDKDVCNLVTELRDVELLDDDTDTTHWVPYVHFGV